MRLLDEAIIFATQAHEGALRKGSQLPYILHPLEAMTIVAAMTSDEEVIAAAVLHDVVEDTAYTNDDIKERFGDRVAELVAYESENKREGQPKEDTWKIRKMEQLEKVEEEPIEAKMIMLADKLSNMRATLRDVTAHPHHHWEKFNMKDEKEQEWYYRTIAEKLSALSDEPAYVEYCEILEKVFKK